MGIQQTRLSALLLAAALVLLPIQVAGSEPAVAAGSDTSPGLPSDVMLFQQDLVVNGATIPHDTAHCATTPVGSMKADGSRVYSAGAG